MEEGTLDAFTSRTINGPRYNRPAFPFKYYISKVGGRGVSDHALILLMQGGGVSLQAKPAYVILECSLNV